MKLTDIHTHILYGVDDGAQTLSDSMDMISEEWKQGVRDIFLTPHYGHKYGYVDRAVLEQRFQKIQQEASKHFPGIHLYLGSELYYQSNTIQHLREGKALTMAGSKYVLVEFGTGDSYFDIFQAVHDMVYAGYLPIIAHIERYDSIRNCMKAVRELMKSGAYLQINAQSILERFPYRKTLFCRKLLKEGLVYFIGSDCHDMETRCPNLERAYRMLSKKEGQQSKFGFYAKKVIEGSYI